MPWRWRRRKVRRIVLPDWSVLAALVPVLLAVSGSTSISANAAQAFTPVSKAVFFSSDGMRLDGVLARAVHAGSAGSSSRYSRGPGTDELAAIGDQTRASASGAAGELRPPAPDEIAMPAQDWADQEREPYGAATPRDWASDRRVESLSAGADGGSSAETASVDCSTNMNERRRDPILIS